MIDDLTTALMKVHRTDLVHEAASSRLARVATSCQPSALRRQAAGLVEWLRHGQLGTGLEDISTAPLTSRCCA
jgi:hypothetical protein